MVQVYDGKRAGDRRRLPEKPLNLIDRQFGSGLVLKSGLREVIGYWMGRQPLIDPR